MCVCVCVSVCVCVCAVFRSTVCVYVRACVRVCNGSTYVYRFTLPKDSVVFGLFQICDSIKSRPTINMLPLFLPPSIPTSLPTSLPSSLSPSHSSSDPPSSVCASHYIYPVFLILSHSSLLVYTPLPPRFRPPLVFFYPFYHSH